MLTTLLVAIGLGAVLWFSQKNARAGMLDGNPLRGRFQDPFLEAIGALLTRNKLRFEIEFIPSEGEKREDITSYKTRARTEDKTRYEIRAIAYRAPDKRGEIHYKFSTSTLVPPGMELRFDASSKESRDFKHMSFPEECDASAVFALFPLAREKVRKKFWAPLEKQIPDGVKSTVFFRADELCIELREVPTKSVESFPVLALGQTLIHTYISMRTGGQPSWAACCSQFASESNIPIAVAMFNTLYKSAADEPDRLKPLAKQSIKFVLHTDLGSHCEKNYNWGLLTSLYELIYEYGAKQKNAPSALARLGHSHFDQDFRRVVCDAFIELTDPLDAIRLGRDADVQMYLKFFQTWVKDAESAAHLTGFSSSSFDLAQVLIRFWRIPSSNLNTLIRMTSVALPKLEYNDYAHAVERVLMEIDLNDHARCARFIELFAIPEREKELLHILNKSKSARRALAITMLGTIGGAESVAVLSELTKPFADVAEVQAAAHDAIERIQDRLAPRRAPDTTRLHA